MHAGPRGDVNRGKHMKQLLIYDRPVVLNRERHRDLKISTRDAGFAFAAQVNSLPLATAEFARAARDYPILFAGAGPENVVPAALLGLRADENLMVDVEGKWEPDSYVPAFLRRYPFVLAEKPAGEEGFSVCLDEAWPGVGAEDGEVLFAEDGSNSALLEGAVKFLQEYQAHLERTRAFTNRLAELDLLVSKTIQVKPASGKPFSLDGFFIVDESRVQALKGKPLQELLKSGDLGWIYAHLLSLVNVEQLSRRLDQRMAGQSRGH